MLRKLIAAVSVLLLAFGLTSVVGGAASAHTGDVSVTATCKADGTVDLKYKLTTSNVPAGKVGKVETSTSATGASFVGSWGHGSFSNWTTRTTSLAPNDSYEWTVNVANFTGNGPWEYVYTTWTKAGTTDVTVKSDTRAEGFKGCTPTKPADLSGKDTRSTQICNVPADGTATVTNYSKAWTQAYKWNGTAWVLDAKVYSAETVTGTSVVDDATCIPTKPDPKSGKEVVPPTHECVVPGNGTATDTTWARDWTQTYTWSASQHKWVLGDKVYGAAYVTGTTTVDDQSCIPTKPGPKSGTEVVPPTHVCADPKNGTAIEKTWARDWTQAYTWDNATHTWVLGAKVYGDAYVTGTKTVDDASCIPTKPGPKSGTETLPPTKVCVEPHNGNATQTSWAKDWTQDYTWNNNTHAWELGAKVYGDKYVTGTTTVTDFAKCSYEEVVCWIVAADGTDGAKEPIPGSHELFPQQRVDCDDVIPCGVWVQKDWYQIDSVADKTTFDGLGELLEWVRGGAEDASIYEKHIFIYGGDCLPYCLIGDTKYYENDELPANYTWSREGTCVPPVVVCYWNGEEGVPVEYPAGQVPEGSKPYVNGDECTPPNIDPTVIAPVCDAGAPYIDIDVTLVDPGGNSTNTDGKIDIKFSKEGFEDYWIYGVQLDNWKAHVLWPGAKVEGGVPTDWPGWAYEGGAWVNVGNDNYGWTRAGVTLTVYYNPHKSFDLDYPEANFDCDAPPPPTQVCEYTQGDAKGHLVEYEYGETVPEGAIPWVNGDECTPDICPNITGNQPVIPDGLTYYQEEDGPKCATPPTLEGTIFSSVCKQDTPLIEYTIKLNDKDGVSTDDGHAYFTFTEPTAPFRTTQVVIDLDPSGTTTGSFLWPGASGTYNPITEKWTPTGWPGWALVDGEWVSIGDDNFGWTRDGVNVTVEVNPSMSATLNYPPPSALCVAGPPTEVHGELDAPPAEAVEAEAQYAG